MTRRLRSSFLLLVDFTARFSASTFNIPFATHATFRGYARPEDDAPSLGDAFWRLEQQSPLAVEESS